MRRSFFVSPCWQERVRKQSLPSERDLDPESIKRRTELFTKYILPHKRLVYSICIKYTFEDGDIEDNYSEVLVHFFRCMGMENYRQYYNDDILEALDKLAPIHKEALLLQQAGYKMEEIVEISFQNGNLKAKNMDTIKSRIFLAKKQMRNLITRDGDAREE